MKIKRKILGLLILIMSASNYVQAQTEFTKGTWEEIKEKARHENKLIFVDLYFEGCMPCAEMDKRVFPDTTIGRLLNTHFVSFKTDVFKEDIGMKLSMKYAVSGYPTFLILAPEGEAVSIFSGFMGVDRFAPVLEQSVAQAKAGKFLGYAPSLDMDYPDFYRKAYTERNRKVSQDTIRAYLASRKDLTDELSFVVMSVFSPGDQAAFFIDHAGGLVEKYGRIPVRNKLSSLVTQEATRLGKAGTAEDFERMLQKTQPIFEGRDWGVFSPGFFRSYYDASLDAEWMLDKLATESETYTEWRDKSNVLAKVIIDAKDQPQILKQLETLYQSALGNDPNAVDLYKASLIQLYLKNYRQAAAYAQKAEQAKPEFYLKKEDIAALLHVAKSEDVSGFEPKRAVLPKPISMD